MSAALIIVAGVLILVLIALSGGAEAFLIALGLTVALVGLVGTIAAAVDARRSSRRIADLVLRGERAMWEAREAAREGRRAAAGAEAAVQQVRLLADDISVAPRAEGIRNVTEGVRQVGLRVDLALHGAVPPADAPTEPLDWQELSSLCEDLGRVLTQSGRVHLPRCWALLGSLIDALETVDPASVGLDPDARPHASQDEVRRIRSAAAAAFDEISRPPDQIPFGVPRREA